MNKSIRTLVVGVALVAGAMAQAVAGIVFSNFPDPLYGGNYLEAPGAGSQQFVLGADTTLVSASISTWTVIGGAQPANMTWSLTSGAHGTGTVYGSGVSAVSNTLFAQAGNFFDVYTTTFALPSIDLAAGSYWLTLQTVDNGGFDTYWGVTTAFTSRGSYTNNSAQWIDTTGLWEHLLRLEGRDSATVPEPGSLALVGLSLAGLLATRRRRA